MKVLSNENVRRFSDNEMFYRKNKICTFYFLSETRGVMIVMQYIVRFFIENFCLSGVIGSIHCFFSQVDNYFPFLHLIYLLLCIVQVL